MTEFERQPSIEGLRHARDLNFKKWQKERQRADERAETIERFAQAIRKMNGDVTHIIAEHVRDPRRATYEAGDFDRRLLKLAQDIRQFAHDILETAE